MGSSESDKGRFVRIVCYRCGNRQIVYGKSSTKVKCERCNKLLVKTSGGKVRIKTIIEEVLR